MRTVSFVIFYGIVLTVYSLINYYIFTRGWQSLPPGSRIRNIYMLAFIILSLSYVIGRVLERYWFSALTKFFLWTGSFWLGAMVYFVLILIVIDLIRLLNLAVPVIPGIWLQNISQTRLILFIGTIITVLVIITAAHINTLIIRTTVLNVELESSGSHMKEVKMAMVSDIHLGSLTTRKRVEKIVAKINSLNPDIIVMAGDMLDEDVGPVIQRDLGSAVEKLSAPLGVFGITGNHEYIGGVSEATDYLTNHGIQIIRDSVIRINDSFYLAGREDRSIEMFSGKKRMSAEELLKDTDALPVILLDHQPLNLEEPAAAGAGLQLSGHTHNGQLWPFNFITSAIYTISSGYGEINGMKVYVSSGVGTWGPPMRLGSRPEIVMINISFQN